MVEVKRMRSPPLPAPRSRPSGRRTPFIRARNASASASMAWASSRRAPLRRTAVSGSSIASGCRRGTTVLFLIMAYRSFGRFRQASTRLDTPPCSHRHHPVSVIARQLALNAIAARPCFVAEPKHYPVTAELARQSIQCRRRVGDASVLPDLATQPAIGDRDNDPILVNIKPDVGDTIRHDPSPMHEARRRPARRNPRYLHTVRRVAPPSGGHVV